MPQLTKEILESFDEKFVVPNGGVMPKHRDFGKTLEKDLKSFLQEVVKRAYEEGQKDLAKDIEVLTNLIPHASILNKKEE